YNTKFLVKNWQEIRKILGKVSAQIHQYQVKKKLLPCKLVYLLHVSRDAAIISYKPMNSAARDYVKYTPLPDLARYNNQQFHNFAIIQLKITFNNTGKIKIRPLLNLSLFIVSLITFVAVIVTSIVLHYIAAKL
ncbi:MAG: hypothetical protein AAF378_25375, partial [Cyanobacteria bacterium P01_A01_bin.84]